MPHSSRRRKKDKRNAPLGNAHNLDATNVGAVKRQSARDRTRARANQKLPTHRELAQRWKGVGLAMGTAAGQTVPNSTITAKRDYTKALLLSGRKPQRLASHWRGFDQGKDERVPTAAVVALTEGIRQQLPTLTPTHAANLNEAYEPMSQLRGDTKNTGFSFPNGDFCQHPTSLNDGIWNAAGQQGLHDQCNRTRNHLALGAAETAAAAPAATAQGIARAATGAAGTYTLNEMYAPPRAANMRLATSSSSPTVAAAELEREHEKYTLHNDFGVPITSGTQLVNADWSGQQGHEPLRPLSPYRVDNDDSKDDHVTKLLAYRKKKEEAEPKGNAKAH